MCEFSRLSSKKCVFELTDLLLVSQDEENIAYLQFDIRRGIEHDVFTRFFYSDHDDIGGFSYIAFLECAVDQA